MSVVEKGVVDDVVLLVLLSAVHMQLDHVEVKLQDTVCVLVEVARSRVARWL